MIYSSLAILTLAASAAIPPFGNFVHLHPRAQTDNRVSVVLVNRAPTFRDVRVMGRSYTITAGNALTVKGPAGTIVYRDSIAPFHEKGEVLVALTPEMKDLIVEVK